MRWVELKRESLPAKLLLQLLEATTEELAAIGRYLAGRPFPDRQQAAAGSVVAQVVADDSLLAGTKAGSCHVFCWTGRFWEVVFAGGRFHLENTLGARYLNYLLHHPNDPIAAFALEVAIEPQKGEARATTSIQRSIDVRAKREYRRELDKLRADQQNARETDDRDEVSRLDGEIEALQSALNHCGGTDDTGERARGNVRKAINVTLRSLLKGGEHERAFAEHIRQRVSKGYTCMYSQPQGRIWT
jgi:hypothetical protein